MRRQFWRLFLAITMSVGLPMGDAFAGCKKVRIGTVGQGFAPAQIARAILEEAYASIGCQTEFVPFPPLRMIAELDNGSIDALIIAEAEFAKDHPGAIQVGTPVWTEELVAFSKTALNIRNWDDLRPFRVGYIKGMRIIEKKLSKSQRMEAVSGTEALFLMLNRDRTDAVVTSKLIGQIMIRELRLPAITNLSPVLEVVPTYHFVGVKRAELVAPLEASLEQMRKTGRMSLLTQTTADSLFSVR